MVLYSKLRPFLVNSRLLSIFSVAHLIAKLWALVSAASSSIGLNFSVNGGVLRLVDVVPFCQYMVSFVSLRYAIICFTRQDVLALPNKDPMARLIAGQGIHLWETHSTVPQVRRLTRHPPVVHIEEDENEDCFASDSQTSITISSLGISQ